MVRGVSDGGGQDRRREDTDAVGSEILEEPRYRRQYRRTTVLFVEQREKSRSRRRTVCVPRVRHKRDVRRVHGLACEQPFGRRFGAVHRAAHDQPVGAFGDVESTGGDDEGRNEGRRVHPAPRVEFRPSQQDEVADARPSECAHGLKGKGPEHQFPAIRAWCAFGNDHVRGRVVAAQRKTESEETDDQRKKISAEDEQSEERAEDDHLHDEHAFAAEIVRHAAKTDGPDEDAKQTRGAGHEDDEPFEKLSRGGEAPDAPLHCRHRHARQGGSIGPGGSFVDVVLNGLSSARRNLRRSIVCHTCT